MTIETQTFYFPLPRFGVPLKDQWEEFRENFNSLAPLVRAAEVDKSNSSGQSDLSYFNFGELDFKNRFRLGYDKTNDRFVIEYNNGTEISPNWVPYLAIRQGDGRLIALGSGGFQSDGGFYNFSTAGFYLWVRPTTGKRYLFDEGEAGLVFDSQYFYLTSVSNSEEVLVSLTPAGVSGEVNTASNLGSGNGVFAQKSGVDLQFKSLVAGSNVTLTPTSTQITIDATGGGSGEANTASNLGAGSGVFAQKSGVDLQFKSLVAGSNVTLTPSANSITISSSGGGGSSGPQFYGINVGETDNTPVYARIQNLKFESANFYITQNNDTDTAIVAFRGTSSGGGSGEANTASNVGSGNGVFKTKSGVDLQFKSLVAGSNVTIDNNTNDLTINATSSVSGGGFYGIVFKESRSGGRIERDDTIVFDSAFFYLTQAGNDGKPLLSLNSSGTGEVNTASNLGAGSGIFAQKSGVDLQFKSLVAGSNITLTPTANTISIASAGGGSVTFAESESGGFSESASTLKFDSSDFYLTSAGDGSPLVSAKQGKKLLATYLPNNASSIDITSVITNEYEVYEIDIRLKPVNNDVELWIRASEDNGSSFDSSSIYDVTQELLFPGLTDQYTFCVALTTGAAAIRIGGNDTNRSVWNGANGFINARIIFYNSGVGTGFQPTFIWTARWNHTENHNIISNGGGRYATNNNLNALRIMFESGNINSGAVRIYGIAK